jgi:hypothetical protein
MTHFYKSNSIFLNLNCNVIGTTVISTIQGYVPGLQSVADDLPSIFGVINSS